MPVSGPRLAGWQLLLPLIWNILFWKASHSENPNPHGEIQHTLPLHSTWSSALPPSSLVDVMEGSRPALCFASRAVPSAVGNAPDLEMEGLGTSPNSALTSCITEENLIVPLSLLPHPSLPSPPRRRKVEDK